MFDGYDSCSEDTSSSSSSDESEEEVAPLPSSLPIIKNNGQVYTYPDGKSGMGKYVVWEYSEFGIYGFKPVLWVPGVGGGVQSQVLVLIEETKTAEGLRLVWFRRGEMFA